MVSDHFAVKAESGHQPLHPCTKYFRSRPTLHLLVFRDISVFVDIPPGTHINTLTLQYNPNVIPCFLLHILFHPLPMARIPHSLPSIKSSIRSSWPLSNFMGSFFLSVWTVQHDREETHHHQHCYHQWRVLHLSFSLC